MGKALLYSLKKHLGKSFTPEKEKAWEGIYGFMSDMMIQGGEL